MDYEEILSEIGLNRWESRTYVALIELGSTTTGPLVKKSEVPPSKIYPVLESLNKKGFINYVIKGKVKYFQAVDPSILNSILKEKEKKIEKIVAELKIKQLTNNSTNKQFVELFEGLKSIKHLLLNLIEQEKSEESWCGFGPGFHDEKIKEFYDWWGPRRESTGIKGRLLVSKQNRNLFEESLKKEDLPLVRKITRYSKVFFPGDVFIYRENVVIIDWKDPPTAIHITSKNLSQQYIDFFEGLWGQAK
jgi:sugar-specific transcriptional regulator TrmB